MSIAHPVSKCFTCGIKETEADICKKCEKIEKKIIRDIGNDHKNLRVWMRESLSK